jgi:hypothetical protein
MNYDSVQITKMQNGFLVSCIKKANPVLREPPSQDDYVFITFKEVLEFLEK